MPGGGQPSLPDPATRSPGGRREGGPPPGPPHATNRRPSPPAALPPGPPPPRHPAAPPSHPPAAGGKAPSRCAARASAGVRTDALALRCSPSGLDPGAGSRSSKCLAVQCSGNLGHLANVVPRPRAALRLAGSETRITGTHVAHRGL